MSAMCQVSVSCDCKNTYYFSINAIIRETFLYYI